MMGLNGHAALATEPITIRRRGRDIVLPPLVRLAMLAESERKARARLLSGRYFLVNMALGDVGEIFRCGRCNGKHARLTKYCLDRPFSGLYGGLYGFVSTVGHAAGLGVLPPPVADRLGQILELFSETDGAPDLAASHPGLARVLAARSTGPATGGSVDLDVGMIGLGLLERMEIRDAQHQLDRINTRAHAYGLAPLIVPGLATRRGT